RNIGEVFGTAATACLEGSCGRQDRKVLVLAVLQHVLDVPGLRVRYDLNRGIVGNQREVGVERRGRLADGTADIGERRLVGVLHGCDDFWLVAYVGDDLAVVIAMVDRPGFAG